MKRLVPIIMAVGVVCLVILAFGVAEGYVPFNCNWPPASIVYDNHTLTTAWKSATSFGSSQWNNVSGSGFEWAPGSAGDNDVYLEALDKQHGTLGRTILSCLNGTAVRFTTRFDTNENWYTGSGTPASNQLDARSVAAHEFGHGLGLDETQANCGGTEITRPTMCPEYTYGKTYFRSLEQDDRNGVVALYPLGALAAKLCSKSTEEVHHNAFLYDSVALPERVRRSDIVVSGIVVNISETRWNQDSGQYWEDVSPDGETIFTGIPYFTVEIALTKSLRARQGAPRRLTFTVFGDSPLSKEDSSKIDWGLGDEVLVFGRKTQMAWRQGSRSILQPIGSLRESTIPRAEDGTFYIYSEGVKQKYSLEELEELIEEQSRR